LVFEIWEDHIIVGILEDFWGLRELYTRPFECFEVEGIEMFAFFVFNIEWEEDKIVEEFEAVGDSIAFEWERLGWDDFFAGFLHDFLGTKAHWWSFSELEGSDENLWINKIYYCF